MYADKITDSMRAAIAETERRREIQMAYNERTWHYTKDDQESSIRDLISI